MGAPTHHCHVADPIYRPGAHGDLVKHDYLMSLQWPITSCQTPTASRKRGILYKSDAMEQMVGVSQHEDHTYGLSYLAPKNEFAVK